MADDNKLHIGISAGVEDLSKGLKEAGKEVDDFAKDVEKSAKKTEKVSVSAEKNTKSLKKLSTSLTDVNSGVKDLTRESGNLGDKLQGLSKVGSGVSGSLTGVGSGALIASGAILAVAAAIGTALYFYGKHRAEAFDLELQYKKLNDRVKEYEKSLWGLNATILKGTQNGAKEIANLRTLRTEIENVNSPMETRLNHLDSLRKKYPSLLQGISDEKLLTGQLASVYDTLTTSILKSARAKAGLEALTENIKKGFTLEAKLIENSIALNSKREKKRLLEAQDTTNAISGFQGGIDDNLAKQEKLDRDINTLKEDRTRILEDHSAIQAENLKLSKTISDNGGIVPIDYGVKGEISEISKELQKLRAAEDEFDKEQLAIRTKDLKGSFSLGDVGETPDFVNQTNAYSQFFSTMSKIQEDYADSVPEWFPTPRVNEENLANDKEILAEGLLDMKDLVEDFNNSMINLIANEMANTLIDLGATIGEALANGENVIAAMGESLIASFGNFLSELGAMLITYGTFAVVKGTLDEIVKTGGWQAVAAGAAAIGVGIAMVAAGAAIGARASSGMSGGASTSGVGGSGSSRRSSGSSVSSSGGVGGGGTYVFEIEGTKLVGVLSNTLSRNRALGGSLGIT